jgi:hypothetical protein
LEYVASEKRLDLQEFVPDIKKSHRFSKRVSKSPRVVRDVASGEVT